VDIDQGKSKKSTLRSSALRAKLPPSSLPSIPFLKKQSRSEARNLPQAKRGSFCSQTQQKRGPKMDFGVFHDAR